MARPKSADKRSAILQAAIEVIADQGDSAPTAKIAKGAGVAEGTLFTYFGNKDELLSGLYLELKAELNSVMMKSFPREANVKVRLHHAWDKYVDWGTANPLKRKAMALLTVSERVNPAAKAEGAKAFVEVAATIDESIAQGALRDLPPDFVSALLGSMAETTMSFMSASKSKAEAGTYREAGFEAFWKAMAWE